MATVEREYQNDPAIEEAWAARAFAYCETYFKVVTKRADRKSLRLTPIDDEIYKEFREAFPDLKVDVFDEDAAKSEAGKKAWRQFLSKFDHERLKDFNMGTLLRIDAKKGIDPDNICLVPRVQFFAVELARNREGHNDSLNPPSTQ